MTQMMTSTIFLQIESNFIWIVLEIDTVIFVKSSFADFNKNIKIKHVDCFDEQNKLDLFSICNLSENSFMNRIVYRKHED